MHVHEPSRRATAEAIGTAALVATVVGSGIMATRLTDDVAVQLLVNALATVAALAVLIWALGPISGAHFNPVVTLVALVRREVGPAEAGRYVVAQIIGGLAGTALGNLMFELPAWHASGHVRATPNLWLGEIVATAGLLSLIGALTRTAADSALVLDVISGATPTDRWRLAPPGMPFAQAAATPPGRLRVGWTTTPVLPGGKVDPQVVSAVAALADRLAGLGHDVQHISPRWPAPTTAFLPQFYAGMRVEAGQVEHPELLEPRTKATVRLSGWATDRVVARALRAGERVTAALDTMFADWDVLLTPTLPVPPPPLGQLDGQGTLRSQIVSTPLVGFTTIFNVSGHPAASVPAGLTREGWPVGAQLVAGMGQEGRLLALAAQLEAAP